MDGAMARPLWSGRNSGRNSSEPAVEAFDLDWLAGGVAAAQLAREASDFHASMREAIERSLLTALDALPEGTWNSAPFECSICLENVEMGQRVRRLACMHCYHTECLDQWLKFSQAGRHRRCPLCNADPFEQPCKEVDGSEDGEIVPLPRATTPPPDDVTAGREVTFGGVPVDTLLPRWTLQALLGGDPGPAAPAAAPEAAASRAGAAATSSQSSSSGRSPSRRSGGALGLLLSA